MVYPIIYRVSTIQGGAGFLPSTVCWMMFTTIPPPHVKTPWAALQLVCSHHHRHPPGPGAFRFSMAILGTDFFGGTIYIYKYIYI